MTNNHAITCDTCLYFVNNQLDNTVTCRYPRECIHKKLLNTDVESSEFVVDQLKHYIYKYGWCGYYGTAYSKIDGYPNCEECKDNSGCKRYNIVKGGI